MQAPCKLHLSAAIGLFKYLKGTADLAICYSAIGDQQPLHNTLNDSLSCPPIVYSDSNFARCPKTAKSTWGYTTIIANAAIS